MGDIDFMKKKKKIDMEVRDVIFHPYRPLIFSCGDGKFFYDYKHKQVCLPFNNRRFC